MTMRSRGRIAVFTLLPLILSACVSGAPERPDLALAIPERWEGVTDGRNLQPLTDHEWWRAFGSDELVGLIERGRAGSFDIAVAVANVRRARLLARIAGAPLVPEITGAAGAARPSIYDASLNASYEVDFWGKNEAMLQGALAELRASEFDRRTVALTVTSEIAAAYVEILWLRQQQAMSKEHLELAGRVMAVVESRRRNGAATELEVTQQREVILSLNRSLLSIEQQEQDDLASLAALLGSSVSSTSIEARGLEDLSRPMLDVGAPSELLARRPDIARIEAQLRAADADIQVARAALFPSVALGAGVGTGGERLVGIFDNPAYSLAAGLTAPIFDRGRRLAGRDLAIVQREALLGAYRSAIVAAFADVEILLNALATQQRQHALQEEVEQLANRTFTLAESRYRAGAEPLLSLLDAQRSLYAARDARVLLHRNRLQASIGLFRALGGGWPAADDDLESLHPEQPTSS